MTLKDILSATRKARRDIELSTLFFDEHNHQPPHAIAHKFFSENMSEDVTPAERKTYSRIVGAWQYRYAKAHPETAPHWLNKRKRGLRENPETQIGFLSVDANGNPVLTGNPVLDVIAQMMATSREFGRRMNIAAGKCLGCGGTLDEEGWCSGEGAVEDYDAHTDPTIDIDALERQVADEMGLN